MTNCAIFVILGFTRSTEYKIQLQTILTLLQLYISLHIVEIDILLPGLWL